jgi:hypothetical protein
VRTPRWTEGAIPDSVRKNEHQSRETNTYEQV